jgi:hypothetical protein
MKEKFKAFIPSRKIVLCCTVSLLVGVIVGISFYNKFGIYTSAEDCILSELHGNNSTSAAQIIARSCKALYPSRESEKKGRFIFND